MTNSIDFDETYTDPESDISRFAAAFGALCLIPIRERRRILEQHRRICRYPAGAFR